MLVPIDGDECPHAVRRPHRDPFDLPRHGEPVAIDELRPSGDVPVYGIGSSTSTSQRPGHEAAFALYEAASTGIHRELYVWNASTFVRA